VESEGERPSLAEEAAAWVPPWERSRVPEEPPPPDDALAEPLAPSDDALAEPPAPSDDALAEPPPVAPAEPGEGDGVSSGADRLSIVEPFGAVERTPEEVEPDAEPAPAAMADPPPDLAELDVEPEPTDPPPGLAELDVEPEPADPPPGPAELDSAALRGALESILLVVDEPVSEVMLAQVLEQPTDRVTATLAELSADYTANDRGFDLRRVAGGWRFYTRGQFASYVERFVLDGQQVRLTQAALETLAVVAYKQPVTRSRISAIRGVNCDGVVRTLVSRGLIEECGTEPESGAFLYRTTTLFLEKLGLDTVDQLPPLAPFLPDDVDDIADAQQR
jgi:segregation and condensation protein B